MRVGVAVALAVLAVARTAAAQCPACTRFWFEGTLQRAIWSGMSSDHENRDVALGDLNGDGRADVAASDYSVFTFLSHADGIFRPGPTLAVGNQTRTVRWPTWTAMVPST